MKLAGQLLSRKAKRNCHVELLSNVVDDAGDSSGDFSQTVHELNSLNHIHE